jgi:superfamily II DNA or RNA helicase
MNLRPYQEHAVAAVEQAHAEHQAALLVLPTGCGKTVVFSHLAARQPKRTLILAHRQELVEQAAEKIRAVTGEHAAIEMGNRYSQERGVYAAAKVVVASVQTMIAGFSGKRRMDRFRPNDFGLVVVDEAHHSAANSYRAVIEYFTKHSGARVLGVTATPDRGDKKGLGDVFQTIAYQYEVADAISDGWLVPVTQQIVHVKSLDFSEVRSRGGDFMEADLARVMQYEKTLQGVVAPAQELTSKLRTVVFATSVDHADRMAEMWNRYDAGCARSVSGRMNRDERRQLLTAFARGDFRVLTSCMVLTEGWDCPAVEAVVMARPTKSRALYAQMLGRGTRPLPGLVDGVEDAYERRLRIETSTKPELKVLDFTGNSAQHKLVCAIDILRPDASVEVREIAVRKAASGIRVDTAVDEAEEEERARRDQARREQEARRAALRARATYSVAAMNPFDVIGRAPPKATAFDRTRQISDGMRNVLLKGGVDPDGMNYAEAKAMCAEIVRRWKAGLCTLKQAKYLKDMGHSPDCTREEARRILDSAWRKTA